MTLCILRVIYQWFVVQHLCSSLDGFENGSSQKKEKGEKKPLGGNICTCVSWQSSTAANG